VSTEVSPRPPLSRLLGWLVGCAVVGWLVVYNVLRIDGSSPAAAAAPALVIGIIAGAVVFGAGLLLVRRLARSGRVLRPEPVEIPSPSEMDDEQRRIVRLAWPALGALAVVALAVGAYLGVDWFTASADDRGLTTLILAAWNILVGLWIGDEALRMRRDEAEGVESLPLGCGLTAILAAVGFSRDLAPGGQLALIVLAGIAGGLAGLAIWRLQGSRGFPLSAVGTVLVAVLSLVLPLVF
jgi:hypothetical protein